MPLKAFHFLYANFNHLLETTVTNAIIAEAAYDITRLAQSLGIVSIAIFQRSVDGTFPTETSMTDEHLRLHSVSVFDTQFITIRAPATWPG